jgi:hypothetical protein
VAASPRALTRPLTPFVRCRPNPATAFGLANLVARVHLPRMGSRKHLAARRIFVRCRADRACLPLSLIPRGFAQSAIAWPTPRSHLDPAGMAAAE